MNSWNQTQNQNMVVGQAQFNPYTNNAWNQYSQQRLPVYSAAPIQGEMAAWQFLMGPNSEIWLPDANQDLIWWIRTDNMGNRTVKPFTVKPYEAEKAVDTNDLAARLTAVEEWINGKSGKSNAKRNTSSPNANTGSNESIN